MLDATVVTRIKQVIQKTLAPLPVAEVHLREGEDHAGNDVIFVAIDLPAGTGQVPGKAYLEAMGSVSDVLLRVGDQRLPLLSTFREGEAEPLDDDSNAPP